MPPAHVLTLLHIRLGVELLLGWRVLQILLHPSWTERALSFDLHINSGVCAMLEASAASSVALRVQPQAYLFSVSLVSFFLWVCWSTCKQRRKRKASKCSLFDNIRIISSDSKGPSNAQDTCLRVSCLSPGYKWCILKLEACL